MGSPLIGSKVSFLDLQFDIFLCFGMLSLSLFLQIYIYMIYMTNFIDLGTKRGSIWSVKKGTSLKMHQCCWVIPVTWFEVRKDSLWMMLIRTLSHSFKGAIHTSWIKERLEHKIVVHTGWSLRAYLWEQVEWQISGNSGREWDQPAPLSLWLL